MRSKKCKHEKPHIFVCSCKESWTPHYKLHPNGFGYLNSPEYTEYLKSSILKRLEWPMSSFFSIKMFKTNKELLELKVAIHSSDFIDTKSLGGGGFKWDVQVNLRTLENFVSKSFIPPCAHIDAHSRYDLDAHIKQCIFTKIRISCQNSRSWCTVLFISNPTFTLAFDIFWG